jgi:hypothetical protein
MQHILDISKLIGAGLCNQLWAIMNALANASNDDVIYVVGFHLDMFCPTTACLSMIINIEETNKRLQKFNCATLAIHDKNKLSQLSSVQIMPLEDNRLCRCIVPSRIIQKMAHHIAPKKPYNAIHIKIDIDAVARQSQPIEVYENLVTIADPEECAREGERIINTPKSQKWLEHWCNKLEQLITRNIPNNIPLYVCTPIFKSIRHRAVEPYLTKLQESIPNLIIIKQPLHKYREISAMIEACIAINAKEFWNDPSSTLSWYIFQQRKYNQIKRYEEEKRMNRLKFLKA